MADHKPTKPLLSTREAAEFLGVTIRTLESYRAQGRGPTFYRLGDRLVRYRVQDLESWLLRVEPERS